MWLITGVLCLAAASNAQNTTTTTALPNTTTTIPSNTTTIFYNTTITTLPNNTTTVFYDTTTTTIPTTNTTTTSSPTNTTRYPPLTTTTTTSPATTTESTACPSGWVNAHDDGCFAFLEETNLTWTEAMEACEQVGGYLAEMKTTSQLELLSGLAGMEEQFTGIQNWWIGLSDLGHEGTWVWVHSFQEVSETFWSSGSPSETQGNKLDCGFAQLTDGLLAWKDLDCEDKDTIGGPIAPICQRGEVTSEDPPTTTAGTTITTNTATTTNTSMTTTTSTPTNGNTTARPPVGDCPELWSQFNSSCYWVVSNVSEHKVWHAAQEACRALHPAANLASVNSKSEEDFLATLFLRDDYFWLGGSDVTTEGQWTWSDGSAFSYTNWYEGQGSGGRTENCLSSHLFYGMVDGWYDDPCSFHNNYVCEISL